VYNIFDHKLNLFTPSQRKLSDVRREFENVEDPELEKLIGPGFANQLREDVELIEGVYPEFDTEAYLSGKIAPVFFGSAVNNFGINEMLDTFIKIAPAPKSRKTDEREVKPDEAKFSGFIFKIHANMDPNHRNRIAFLRICSGKFERNKPYNHVGGVKPLRFSNVTQFMAQDKEIIDEAFPGDIVGLYDTGNLKIGDTLTEGENMVFTGIPSFSPEIFREVVNKDAMKTKQLEKGLKQLMEEGVAQLFTFDIGSRKVVGTVGQLQFEVIQFRLKNEYNATVEFQSMNLYKACWITSKDKKQLEEFVRSKNRHIAHDKEGKLVFMAESKAWLQMVQENYPEIEFHFTSEL
jgi:peptide chain release factor 3